MLSPITDVIVAALEFIWKYILVFWGETWWFFLFIVLLPVARSTWIYWRQIVYRHNIKYVVLEMRIPRETTKNPRAMEQVLRAFHFMRNAANNLREIYWDGEVTNWVSLEIVGRGGEVHFYVRCLKSRRPLVEAAFFSSYQDVELVEVPDYAEMLPKSAEELWDRGLDFFGGELELVKPDMYPLRTYLEFEVPDEDIQLIDPISNALEILGKLTKDEFAAIQINIAPADYSWAKEWEDELAKLRKIGTKAAMEEEGGSLTTRTPGQTRILKAVEEKLGRQAFNTMGRIVYVCPKAVYSDTVPRRGLIGALNQYATADMNAFKWNFPAGTRTQLWDWPYIFPKLRGKLRKKRYWHWFIHREMPEEQWTGKLLSSHPLNWNFYSKTMHLDIAEMATIFHPPTHVVLTAPHIHRVESKKAGAPSGLPIFGDETAIDKFT